LDDYGFCNAPVAHRIHSLDCRTLSLDLRCQLGVLIKV
jgi:hypothetical protein